MTKKKLLLHSCCGPCSTSCLERLFQDYDVTVFYYDPCINERDEYEKRLGNQKAFIDAVNGSGFPVKDENGNELPEGDRPKCDIGFAEGTYDPERYEELVKGLENEPEGGARCKVCFGMRLDETARYAGEHGYDCFTTTLTVSPHKDHALISEIGKECGEKYGVEYLPFDFKKKNGFGRSVELSKEFGLYRQDFCGCTYSKRR